MSQPHPAEEFELKVEPEHEEEQLDPELPERFQLDLRGPGAQIWDTS